MFRTCCNVQDLEGTASSVPIKNKYCMKSGSNKLAYKMLVDMTSTTEKRGFFRQDILRLPGHSLLPSVLNNEEELVHCDTCES